MAFDRDLGPYEREVLDAAEQHLEEVGVGSKFDRRWFMKMALATAAGGTVLGSSAGRLNAASLVAEASKASGKLNGFNYAFFTDPKLYTAYKKAHGYIPTWTTFDPPGTHQIPKLKAHPGLYDLVVLSSNASKYFIQANVLRPWDTSKIPNYKTIFESFRKFDNSLTGGRTYEIATFWGHNSIAYNTKVVSAKDARTIRSLFDPKFKGQIAMEAEPPESFALAGMYLGFKHPYHQTEEQYKRSAELLVKQKPLVRAYWTQLGELAPLFAQKEVTIAWAWPPIESMTKDSGVNVKFVNNLKEGGVGWDTGWGLAKAAKNVDEAHAFVNWELSPTRIKLLADQNFASASQTALKVLPKSKIKQFHLENPNKFLSSLAFQEFTWKNELIAKLWQDVQTA